MKSFRAIASKAMNQGPGSCGTHFEVDINGPAVRWQFEDYGHRTSSSTRATEKVAPEGGRRQRDAEVDIVLIEVVPLPDGPAPHPEQWNGVHTLSPTAVAKTQP